MDLNDPGISATAIVRQLLATLEQSALSEEARVLRRRFEARGWKGLGPEDITQVAALVARIPTAAEPPLEVKSEESARVESGSWSPLENFSAWVDAVPRGRQVLALLEELTRCDEGDAAASLLTRLFVEHLRYEAHAVDETSRLDSTRILRRLRTIARHGEFVVSLVELSFPYPWPNTFQPIFRRHPYGLVVAVAPGWNSCQFVYRVAKDANSLVQRTRSLLGFLWGDQGQDNLALWIRRLDLLRPSGGEDGAMMLRRVEEALAASPVAVSRQWPSVSLNSGESPPGVVWNTLLTHERRSFLQEERPGTGRLAWGLERALRESFPFNMALKQGRLRYRGYTLGEANDPQVAFQRGGSWVRSLTLELELVCEDDGAVLPLSIAAAVPEVDETGRFLIDGTWLRWVPRVLSEGLLVGGREKSLLAQVAEEDAAAELELVEPPPSESGAVPADGAPALEESPPEPPVPEEEEVPPPEWLSETSASPLSFAGASLRTFLEVAAHRKLYSLRLSVRSYADKARDLPKVLRVVLRGLAGRDSVPLLVSKVFLKAFLVPDRSREAPEGAWPILQQASPSKADFPPAWACPEVSASLPPGCWLPVAGARLTPAGELAVSLRDASGQERLQVSSLPLNQINPRVGGAGSGPPSGWLAAELAPFAALPLGRLREAIPFLVKGHPLPEGLRVLRVHGSELRARATGDAPLFPRTSGRRELRARIPAILAGNDAPSHRVLVARGSIVKPGEVWLEAPLELWARDAASWTPSTQKLHWTRSGDLLAHVFQLETPEEELEEREPSPEAGVLEGADPPEPGVDTGLSPLPSAEVVLPLKPILPEAAERWFVPPGVHGTVMEVREEAERSKTGDLLSWRLTLVVLLELPVVARGQLLLPDGRAVLCEGGRSREEMPYGEDGEPVHLLIEDPSLTEGAGTEIWFDGASGELLETATSRVGRCWLLREGPPVVGPDERLRFRARDGEGIPAAPDAPALSTWEQLWWAAANPGEAAALAKQARAWTGGIPGFWPHLLEVLEAALVVPPTLAVAESWRDVSTARREVAFKLPRVTQLRAWPTTYTELAQDAPLRWSCRCGLFQGRARAFELCLPEPSGCGTPVVLRPALRGRRPLPRFRLSEPVLHPWRKVTAAGLLGLTVAELEWRCVKDGALLLGLQLDKAVREGAPGALLRERLTHTSVPGERESLLAALRAVERDVTTFGQEVVSRLLVSAVPMLPASLHPTGLPRGASERVEAPLTRAYLRVHLASDRLERLRRSGSRLLVETARRTLHSEMEALFGPVSQRRQDGEPTHLAGLVARLWPLTRAPGLRSVVPGTFRLQGQPAREVAARVEEVEVERIPSPPELAARPSEPDERWTSLQGSPRRGVVPVRLQVERAPGEVSTTGVLLPEGPVYLPVLEPLSIPLSAPEFWAERAARQRLLRQHLPGLMLVLGALHVRADEGEASGEAPAGVLESPRCPDPSVQALLHEGVELPAQAPVGLLALRELMAGLARPESRPLEFCRLMEETRPRSCSEEGLRAAAMLEPMVRQAFPGEGVWPRMSRRLLVRALVGWWKGPASEMAPSGWRWLPPLERGPAGTRRCVPPWASAAWEEWPGMRAATHPVRFLLEHEGQPVEGRWSQTLRAVLGFEDPPLSSFEVPTEPPAPGAPLPSEPAEEVPPLELPVEALPEPPPPVPGMDEPGISPGGLVVLEVSPDTPEVALLSSSMSNWLKGGVSR